MKKNTENSKNNAINEDIVRTARRYEECTLSTKETNQQAENCRQQLQQYAKEHPELFSSSKTVSIPGTNVSLTMSERTAYELDQDAVTPQLLTEFLDTPSSGALVVKLKPSELDLTDADTARLLKLMGCRTVVTQVFSAKISATAR